jgi:hypothetical protein
MRAVGGSLVTVGAVVVMLLIGGSMVSERLDRCGTLLPRAGQEVNLAMATRDRIRSLINQLQVR